MARQITFGKTVINEQSPCFVIAEIGINHGGDVETAKKLIKAAADSGASCVKFQTYITEKRVKKDSAIYDILKKCELSFKDQAMLKEYAEKEAGMMFFSTPFDDESVDFLESVNVGLYKIASFDSVNLSLLKKVASTGKPIIMSTGMTSREELSKALESFKDSNVALLHCVSSYPTPEKEADIRTIFTLKDLYPNRVIGYSDHTMGSRVPILGVAAGAKIIEKHFTLDTKAQGPDHSISADPTTLKEMIRGIREVEEILGAGELKQRKAEAGIVQYRRHSN